MAFLRNKIKYYSNKTLENQNALFYVTEEMQANIDVSEGRKCRIILTTHALSYRWLLCTIPFNVLLRPISDRKKKFACNRFTSGKRLRFVWRG